MCLNIHTWLVLLNLWQQSMATEALQQAQAEKLTLLVADNTTGYFGVHLNKHGLSKPYQAQVRRGGRTVSLGCFATAEEAALCVARSLEGQAAAGRAAAVEGQDTLPAVPSGASLKDEGTRSLLCRPAPSSRERARSRPCRPMPSSRSRSSSRKRRASLMAGLRGNGRSDYTHRTSVDWNVDVYRLYPYNT